MPIHKECADHLRALHSTRTSGRLSSGHAHELVAAYFGYGTGAALRAEHAFPLDRLDEAEILIPDLPLIETRRQQLAGLPTDLATTSDLASDLTEFLRDRGHFSGEEWHTPDLADYIVSDFLQKDPMLIEDALSGEIAQTNAFFDELNIDEVDLDRGPDALVVSVSGALNGENDEDRAFHGDSIAFSSIITFPRAAARIGFLKPALETSGEVDDSRYYGDDS